MQLSGQQLKQIQEALLSAFPGKDDLAMLARLELNEPLGAIAGGENQRVLIFNLLTWAERTGRVADLLAGAISQLPGNPLLQRLMQDARGWGLPAHVAAQPATPYPPSSSAPAVIDIFLSYSHLDAEIMQRLHADLRAAGFAVWIDEGLEPGTPHWQAAIEEAIAQARCLVVILTPNAKASHWVQSEISYARELGHPIYPLLAAGDVRSAVPIGLVNAQRVDIRQGYGAVANALLPALHNYLNPGATSALRPPAQPAKPIPKAPATVKTPIDFDWVEIPAGEFVMGSNDYDDEKPPHTLYLPTYYIARTPLTNAQYQHYVRATGQPAPSHWEDGQIPKGKENHPVVYISWHDALAFCHWANVRLPTEAEWEKAARGTDGRIYPWGDSKPDKSRANFYREVGDTTPVGAYPKGASPYGVLDMAGNVWEWTSSLNMGYPYAADDGREDLNAEGRRVVRGGFWFDGPFFLRGAGRLWDSPDGRDYYLGVRLAVSASPD